MKRLLYRRRWLIRVIALVGALVAAYLGARHAWRTAHEDDVYAAALRHWCEHSLPSASRGQALYVQLDGKDPDEQLIGRLRESVPGARKYSERPIPPDAGVRVGLCDLTWVGWTAARVSVVDTCTWTRVGGQHYRVVRRGGRWDVASVAAFGYEVYRAPPRPDRRPP